MEKLPKQFKDALSRIEISGEKRDRAIAAHSQIRGYLEEDPQLRRWGVDTVLIGSYARRTGIYPGRDVDVFSKLAKLDSNADPGAVFRTLVDILKGRYGERAQPQDRSVKVSFPLDDDEFGVDVVPAVRIKNRWGIPSRDKERWAYPGLTDRWVETDPERLGKLTTEMNGRLTVDGQGAYVPLVKLVRQARSHHRGDEKPGGLYFELLTYWAFEAGIDGNSFAEVFTSTLGSKSKQLAGPAPLIDPVLGRPYTPKPDPRDRTAAAAIFADLASRADKALRTSGPCPAAAIWRQILGSNQRGPCFPLPPGCDETGKPIRRIAPVAAKGSEEASGFA